MLHFMISKNYLLTDNRTVYIHNFSPKKTFYFMKEYKYSYN